MAQYGEALCLTVEEDRFIVEGKDSSNTDTTITYIQKYRDHFYIKGIFSQKIFRLSFADHTQSERTMRFEPNLGNYTGFGVFIFDLGLEVQFRTPPGKDDNARYGPSEGLDWQVNVYARKIGIDFSYQEYKGFYLSNPEDYYPDWSNGDPYPHHNEMRARVINLGFYYVFRYNRFSFPSIFNQTEAQLISGGSWLLTGNLNSSEIDDPVSIIPQTDSNQLVGLKGLRSINVSAINVLPGYTYNIVIKHKFYMNLSLAIGIGYQFRSYQGDDFYRDNSVNLATLWRLGGGYNGSRFFCGLTAFTQQTNINIDNLAIGAQGGFIKFFAGYRFQERGFLKKSVFDIFRKRK